MLSISGGFEGSPEVVRGLIPMWLQVGGGVLLGGDPTVNITVRGLAPVRVGMP